MGIAEEYAKRVKTPIIKVTVTKFFEGQTPGVEAVGTDYYPEVISCNITYGFDQASTTCTLEFKTPLDLYGDYVRFDPMNRIKVEQGWNVPSTYRISFFGFIDKVEYANPPKTVRLECRDILKLAQDNYYINSNRKVYSSVVTESELDGDGNPMGGQSVTDRQAQEIITDFMVESGIPSGYLHLDFIEYPASGSIIIGNNAIAVFVYESSIDACTRITDLIGYRLWADKGGHVQSREVRPIGSSTPAQTYRSQEETYDGAGVWTITQSGTLLSLSVSREDDLRNWVTVYGYNGISTTIAGDSDYVADPPRYRRTEIRSYLLDTPELLFAVASGIYNDLNRLRYTARVTIEGDPRLEIGQTIRLYDPYTMTDTIDYFLYDFTSSLKAGLWTMDLNLVGGTGDGTEGSPSIGNVSPVAMFYESWKEIEYLADGSVIFEVTVDATPSYDPSGPLDELIYLWTCSGYDDAHDTVNTYVVEEGGVIYVTLTVTDQGDPPLSDSVALSVNLSASVGVKQRTIFAASDKYIYSSSNGGETWAEQELW